MAHVIYSRWRPDDGGYDYFSSDERQNINDDLPSPDLVPASKIGVPSIEAGRPIPPGVVGAGNGDAAVGLVAPVDVSRIVRRGRSLAGSDPMRIYSSPWFYVGGAVTIAAVVYFMRDK